MLKSPTTDARERLGQLGINAKTAALIRIETTPGIRDKDPERGMMTFSYECNGKTTELASINTHNASDVIEMCSDRSKIATFLSLGVRLMPADIRPVLPAWVAEESEASAMLANLNRAKLLARNAAKGVAVKNEPISVGADDLF